MWTRTPRYRGSRGGRVASPRRLQRELPAWLGLLSPLQVGLLIVLGTLLLLSFAFPDPLAVYRFALYVYLLAVVAWVSVSLVLRGSAPAPPLGGERASPSGSSGELARVVRLLNRADRGMRFSQRRLLFRARRAFVGKVAAQAGLTEEEVEARLADPEEREALVADPTLRAFLEVTQPVGDPTASELRTRLPDVELPRGQTLTENLAPVLEAMEAWR